MARFALQVLTRTMNAKPAKTDPPAKPISLGLTCWLWEWSRARSIVQLAGKWGVSLQLTQHIRWFYREIDCEVSGENVDQFISEFVRLC